MKHKTNWRDVPGVHIWATKVWWGINPKLFLSTGLLETVDALTPTSRSGCRHRSSMNYQAAEIRTFFGSGSS